MKKSYFSELLDLYAALKPFYRKTRRGRARSDLMFQNCLRASFSKAYEFNVLANTRSGKIPAFFLTPGLRSICEDLILLRYLGSLREPNRNRLIGLLMNHEVLTNLKAQESFFAENRSFQPVLHAPTDYKAQVEKAVTDLQAFWKPRGWTLNGKAILPQIRQLAERRGIATLYDFIYRLTCDVVHFNPQVLLRSGWGKLPQVEFSTKNFELYYRAFAVIYGSFLFCIYFELLRSHLRPDAKTMRIVGKIRNAVGEPNRWPEIVTFEEMNLKSPFDGSPLLQILNKLAFEKTKQGKRKRLLHRGKFAASRNTPSLPAGHSGSPGTGKSGGT